LLGEAFTMLNGLSKKRVVRRLRMDDLSEFERTIGYPSKMDSYTNEIYAHEIKDLMVREGTLIFRLL
jgi:hypothetical protein